MFSKKKIIGIVFAGALGLGISAAANAALVNRGGGLIYDDDLKITWLQNANYGAGSSYDNGYSSTDGTMTWQNAVNWAADLSYYDSVRNVTYTDWRLPATLQPDATCSTQSGGDSSGYNCTGSELGHLFYNELGGVAGEFITTTHNSNYNLFQNILSDFYWSGMEYAPDPARVWGFDFYDGQQLAGNPNYDDYAWAVRSGDVAAVPLPAAAWLFGSGLLGLIGVARRKRRAAH